MKTFLMNCVIASIVSVGIGLTHLSSLAQSPAAAQIENDTESQIQEFYALNGGEDNFPEITQNIMQAYLYAEDAVAAADFEAAREIIDDLLSEYPLTSNVWRRASYPAGLNLGSPTGHYGIRMLDEITRQGLINQGKKSQPLTLTVVTVSCAEGAQPTKLPTETGFDESDSKAVSLTLNPEIRENDHYVIRQGAQLFQQYINAITSGERHLQLRFIAEEDTCASVNSPTGGLWVGPTNSLNIIDNLPNHVKDSSDMYWFIYPTNIPEDPLFHGMTLISGGANSYDGRMLYMMDDRSLLLNELRLGSRTMSDVERRIYHPQWMHHEYFHHLALREFPEFELEKTSHQWFNFSNWPEDFDPWIWGEADYYSEALHKRFYSASPGVTDRLTYTQFAEKPVKVYSGDNYTELAWGLDLGTYTASVLSESPVGINAISSIEIAEGYAVKLCDGVEGNSGSVCETYTESTPRLESLLDNRGAYISVTPYTDVGGSKIDRTNWSLSASIGIADIYKAIDGSDDTRWTTPGETQRNGQSFTIDLNQTDIFDRIVLDSSGSNNDQPRQYEVHVSTDCGNWGSAIASGEGDPGGITTIDFSDQNARCVRITQIGSASNNWWSIHEINLFLVSDSSSNESELDRTNWLLSASSNSTDVYQAIDGSTDTRWTTGQTQRDGQELIIDLSDTLSFDRIILDSTNSQNDQPRQYEIHVSTDGISWGSTIANGDGNASGLTTIDFADQSTRFVRISQTGSALTNWWSIHEINIYANSNSLSTVVEVELDPTDWQLSASIGEDDIYKAIDGSIDTRWTTVNETQRYGQSFTVDLNNVQAFDRIVLNSAKSSNDQIRKYEIYVSTNGAYWGFPIARGEGDIGGITIIDFEDQNARFVRIFQAGSASTNWWSIHEINMFSNSN